MNTEDTIKDHTVLKSETPARPSLEEEICAAINRCSAENGSNTPDFILARYLMGCLENFNCAVNARDRWSGRPISIPASAPMPLNLEPGAVVMRVSASDHAEIVKRYIARIIEVERALKHLLDDWERTAAGFPQHIELRYAARDGARAALNTDKEREP